MSLFELLDWCVAHTPANTVTAHSGLELLPSTSDISATTVCNTSTKSRLGSCEWDHLVEGESLQGAVEGALMELSRVVVRHNADKYAVAWILFCRAVALSLRSSAGKSEPTGAAGAGEVEEEDGGAEEAGDDEDGFVVVTETISGRKNTPSPHTKDKGEKGTGVAPVLSYQQYAVWCRDQAVSKVQGLPLIVRVRVKSVAVGCASETIHQLLLSRDREVEGKGKGKEEDTHGQAQGQGQGHSNEAGQRVMHRRGTLADEHIDLGLARRSSQLALAAVAASGDRLVAGTGAGIGTGVGTVAGQGVGVSTGTGQGMLNDVPCYLALFMHDVINLACACASFTIDDNRILGLLKVSIHLLKGTVDLFKRSLDPDSDSSQAAPTKVLSQFISQLMSAVRPCFTLSRSPALLGLAGTLTITLIEEGLVVDKVVLKRLVKALTQTEEMTQNSSSARNINITDSAVSTGLPDSTSVRAAVSLEDNEDVGALEHIMRACAAARLYSLANDATPHTDAEAMRPGSDSTSSPHHNGAAAAGGGGGVGEGVSSDACACINAVMKSRIPHFRALWLAIAVDSARVMQSAGGDALVVMVSQEQGQGQGGGGDMSSGVVLQELGVRSNKDNKGQGKPLHASRSFDSQYAPPVATEGREPVAPPVKDLSSLVTVSSHSLDGADQSVVCVNLKSADNTATDPFRITVDIAVPSRGAQTAHTALTSKGGYIWTQSTAETDARRGGLIYGPFVRPSILRDTLEKNLPAVIAASALALKINSSSSSSSGGGKSNGTDEHNTEGGSDLMNQLVARSKAEQGKVTTAATSTRPTAAAAGTDDVCDASLLFAIGMTALTHRLKKLKSRKIKSSSAQHKTDVDRLCAVMTALTLLSSLPFSTFSPSHPPFDIEAEKKVEKPVSSIPQSQWSRLISFTMRTLLPISRNQSTAGILDNHSPSPSIRSSSLHNSAFLLYLINITCNLSKEFRYARRGSGSSSSRRSSSSSSSGSASSSSSGNGSGIKDKEDATVGDEIIVCGADTLNSTVQVGTDSKHSDGVADASVGVNNEAHKLKSWIVTVSIYLLSCIFPVTSSSLVSSEGRSNATSGSRKEGTGVEVGVGVSGEEQLLKRLLKGCLPCLTTTPHCMTAQDESAMTAALRLLQRCSVQSSSGNELIAACALAFTIAPVHPHDIHPFIALERIDTLTNDPYLFPFLTL